MFWTGKQSQELMSLPKAQHHTLPNSCWLARQGQPSLFRSQAVWHFLASRRTFSCCTVGLVTITPYSSSWSPGHICGCQPAQVTPRWAPDPKCPWKQLGRAARKCSGGVRPWDPRPRHTFGSREVWLGGSPANGFKEPSSSQWFPWARHCAKCLLCVISLNVPRNAEARYGSLSSILRPTSNMGRRQDTQTRVRMHARTHTVSKWAQLVIIYHVVYLVSLFSLAWKLWRRQGLSPFCSLLVPRDQDSAWQRTGRQ